MSALAERYDLAGCVPAGDDRKAVLEDTFEQAFADLPVDRIDRRRADPDQHLARPGSGIVPLADLHDVTAAKVLVKGRLHNTPPEKPSG